MPTFPTQTRTMNDPVISTMESYIRKTPADVIFNHSLLLSVLFNSAKEPGVAGPAVKALGLAGKSRTLTKNARELWIPVQIGRSSNSVAFNHLDTMPTNLDSGLTRQFAKFARYSDFAAISTTETLENSGEEAIIDIFQTRVDRVFNTLSETIEGDLWSTNTDTNETTQKELIGLQHLIDTTPTTGTVWGIDRGTYTWQRNQAAASVGSFASGGVDAMDSMFTDLASTNGIDGPTVIITTPDIYNFYEKAVRGKQQINDNGVGDLGFPMIRYKGIPLTYSNSCPSGTMYMLNLKYFYLIKEAGAQWQQKWIATPNDQLIEKQVRIFTGLQWGCERYDRQGVLAGITA